MRLNTVSALGACVVDESDEGDKNRRSRQFGSAGAKSAVTKIFAVQRL